MASTKLNQSRAAELIIRISETGVSKKTAEPNSLISLGTQRDYKVCVKSYLDWRDDNALPNSSQDKKADLQHYLEEQSENCQQKTLCQHRMALNAAFFKKLPFVKSLLDTVQSARDYRLSEVLLLIQNVETKNAIAILLCFYSGLRAHELATLQHTDEGVRSNTRSWSIELFANMLPI
jgi:integrase